MPSSPHERPINLQDHLTNITSHWTPAHLLTLNASSSFKLARISGSFIWHAHPDTDEVFYIVSGGPLLMDIATSLTTKHEDDGFETVVLNKGDLFNVGRGWRHRPRVEGEGNEAGILMVERVGTVNTGDEQGKEEGRVRTVEVDEGLDGKGMGK